MGVQGRYYIGTKDVSFDNKIVYDNGISIPLQYERDLRIALANSILMCIEGGRAGKKIAVLNQDVYFGNKLCCFSPFMEKETKNLEYQKAVLFQILRFLSAHNTCYGLNLLYYTQLFCKWW